MVLSTACFNDRPKRYNVARLLHLSLLLHRGREEEAEQDPHLVQGDPSVAVLKILVLDVLIVGFIVTNQPYHIKYLECRREDAEKRKRVFINYKSILNALILYRAIH